VLSTKFSTGLQSSNYSVTVSCKIYDIYLGFTESTVSLTVKPSSSRRLSTNLAVSSIWNSYLDYTMESFHLTNRPEQINTSMLSLNRIVRSSIDIHAIPAPNFRLAENVWMGISVCWVITTRFAIHQVVRISLQD